MSWRLRQLAIIKRANLPDIAAQRYRENVTRNRAGIAADGAGKIYVFVATPIVVASTIAAFAGTNIRLVIRARRGDPQAKRL